MPSIKTNQYSAFFKFLSLCIIGSWIYIYALHAFPDPQGSDFYPQWFATKIWLEGKNPYDINQTLELRRVWSTPQTNHVPVFLAYTFPAILLNLPFSIFSQGTALYLWIVCLLGTALVSGIYFRTKKLPFIFPLLFYPLFHAEILKQTSVLILGIFFLILLLKERRPLVAGILCAALPMKPQMGMLLWLFCFLEGFFENRTFLRWNLISTTSLLVLSLVLKPDWSVEWSHIMQQTWREFNRLSLSVSLLPEALILLFCSLRLSWLGIASVLQVILFPVNDLYSALPLLVAWGEVGGCISIFGISISLIAPLIFSNPNNLGSLWLTVLIPFAATAAIKSFWNYKRGGQPKEFCRSV